MAALANVAHSHTWLRTYANPARMSPATEVGSALGM